MVFPQLVNRKLFKITKLSPKTGNLTVNLQIIIFICSSFMVRGKHWKDSHGKGNIEFPQYLAWEEGLLPLFYRMIFSTAKLLKSRYSTSSIVSIIVDQTSRYSSETHHNNLSTHLLNSCSKTYLELQVLLSRSYQTYSSLT